MKRKNNKNDISFFPSKERLSKIREKMLAPNYPRVNMTLPKNATSLEKSKYSLCKKILNYKLDNSLPVEEVAQQIQLTIPETEDILFARINKFTLDRLVVYANNLFPFHLDIHEDLPKKTTRSSVRVKKDIFVPSRTRSKSKVLHLRK